MRIIIGTKVAAKLILIFPKKVQANYESSCLEVICEKGVSKNFAKFTGKHLCQSLFFNKVAKDLGG